MDKEVQKIGIYESYIKRIFDFVCALAALIVFCWLYLIIALLIKIKLGSPVLFKQPRPGKNEKIFCLYKFRTMTNEKDESGNLLPDEIRLTKLGKFLRKTSLDELPQAINILKGEMSVVGPRPLLVKDMTFMTDEQRLRHTVRPGLSGLAQINGRNGIIWESKLDLDVLYVKNISFFKDVKIIFMTIFKAFIKCDGITEDNMETSEDFGDYLLRKGRVDKFEYTEKQDEARYILRQIGM